MKRFLLMIMVLVNVVMFCSCGIVNQGETSNGLEEETINFDLSQYDDHGELSCGRIWCSITEGGWDTANTTKFAYFDCDGNRISKWFEGDRYEPVDYKNDFIVFFVEDSIPTGVYLDLEIYDVNGKCVVDNFSYYLGYKIGRSFSGFNSTGVACSYGYKYGDEKGFYWLDSTGAHRFKIDKDLKDYYSLDAEDYKAEKNGEYVLLFLDGSYNGFYDHVGVFNKSGKMILSITESLGNKDVRSAYVENNEIHVVFKGADYDVYSCVLDMKGNFIEEPK